MKMENISEKELKNVSAGAVEEGFATGGACPKCKQSIDFDEAEVRTEKNGCSETVYYKCPKCGYEWSKTES